MPWHHASCTLSRTTVSWLVRRLSCGCSRHSSSGSGLRPRWRGWAGHSDTCNQARGLAASFHLGHVAQSRLLHSSKSKLSSHEYTCQSGWHRCCDVSDKLHPANCLRMSTPGACLCRRGPSARIVMLWQPMRSGYGLPGMRRGKLHCARLRPPSWPS